MSQKSFSKRAVEADALRLRHRANRGSKHYNLGNGHQVTFSIRRACREDANFVLELFTLPHVREFTHGPKSIEVFVNALERGDRELLIIDRGGRPFGHLVIAVLDGWLMEIRVIAFEEQRTGAGRFSMEWLLHRAFEDLGLHRIFLEVVESNTGAQALYERVGFLREGCYRDGYRADDGTFHNLIPYGILSPQDSRASNC